MQDHTMANNTLIDASMQLDKTILKRQLHKSSASE